LVDDDRDDSLIFSKLICHLRNYRIDFSWTADYDNARELIASHDYHLHFVDYRLGARSGLELMEQSLRDSPEKNFVLVSGFGNEAVAAESIRLGALDYIAKANLTADELNRCLSHCVSTIADRTRRVRELELAKIDGLTGVYRREAFESAVRQRMLASLDGALWTLLFVDIDNFKDVNDSRGHLHGDEVLRKVADAIRACLRKRDMVCRFGGDEFSVLISGGDADSGLAMAERIRHAVSARAGVTVSVGLAQERGPGDRLMSLTGKADKMMYRAKEQGRNRSEIWRD